MSNHNEDIVITGIGMVTPSGIGLQENLENIKAGKLPAARSELVLDGFKPAKMLSDRRMLKSVSKSDGYGLAAIEDMKKNAAWENRNYDAPKMGLFVGSQASVYLDNSDYIGSMEETRGADGKMDELAFGETCMSSRPTTLLTGLPNNVLCYGAIIMNAKGPNNNYTSGDIGAQIALSTTAKAIQRNKLDAGVAGGFSATTDPVANRMHFLHGDRTESEAINMKPFEDNNHGLLNSNGAAFVSLETRENAEKAGATVLATYIDSAFSADHGATPQANTMDESSVSSIINRVLKNSNVSQNDIGLVFLTGSGAKKTDDCELKAMAATFTTNKPALATTSRAWGTMTDGGGIGEIGLIPTLFADGELPAALRIPNQESKIDSTKPFTLVVRTGIWGDTSCILLRK